jgi:hypothetical protein
MTDLYRLRQEHAQLTDTVGKLSMMIDCSIPPPMSDLFRVRHDLSFTLIAHLKAEDWVLYPRMFASPDARVAQTAFEFAVEMGGLADVFADYVDRWSAHSIEEDWDGYRAETRCMIDALTKRITREDRELYPMLEATAQAA